MAVLDVAEDTAGADRGELLIISDKRTLAPRLMANWTAASSDKVSAMPASSMINKVDGPTAAAHSGMSPCCSDQVSFARVSLRIPVCSARTAAAAADGARPST